MKRAIHENPMATASLTLLAAGWIWTGVFWASGLHLRYAASWWVQGIVFCCFLFSPVALLLGVGGMIWEERKGRGWLAALLSLASAALIFWIFR